MPEGTARGKEDLDSTERKALLVAPTPLMPQERPLEAVGGGKEAMDDLANGRSSQNEGRSAADKFAGELDGLIESDRESWKESAAKRSSQNVVMKSNGGRCDCRATALIVDDNAFNLIPLSTLLQTLGVTARQALSGQEAIDLFIEDRKKTCCNVKFQVVFMDLNMPIMDGF